MKPEFKPWETEMDEEQTALPNGQKFFNPRKMSYLEYSNSIRRIEELNDDQYNQTSLFEFE